MMLPRALLLRGRGVNLSLNPTANLNLSPRLTTPKENQT